MSNFWSQDEEFRDIPDEVEEGQAAPEPLLPPTQQRPARTQPKQEQVVEDYEDVSVSPVSISDQDLDVEEDYSAVLNDARLRLEQGRLYEMIMNHDLFDGLNADPKAIRFVQKEIRKFAKERMEIMLGMRQEQPKAGPVEVELPFNQLEITILKKLASAATKGATEKAEANQARVVAAPAPKKETLTPIGSKPKKTLAAPAPSSDTPTKAQVEKALPSKPSKPVQRPKVEAKTEVVDADSDYVPLEKHPSEMTEQEFEERAKQTTARLAKQKRAIAQNAVPQLSYEQEEMLHTTRAVNAAPAVSAIMTILNSQKK
jgi:hypothetical protein